MKKQLTTLAAVSIAALISGCINNSQSMIEIARTQQRHAVEISEINEILKKHSEEISAIKNYNSNPEDKLVDSAMFIVKNGPVNTKYQAIQILGYLGGEKAENALLKILKEPMGKTYTSQIVSALSQMHSSKLREIIITFLKSGNYQQKEAAINALQNRSTRILKKEDLPLLERVIDEIPDDNNNRYRRNNIIKAICYLDEDKGVQLMCDDLETANSYHQRDLIYIPVHGGVTLSFRSWKKITDIVGEPDDTNMDVFYALCTAFSRKPDFRFTDIILPWAEFSKKDSRFKNAYINMLTVLKDPRSAKVYLELCGDNNFKNNHQLHNFPGIIKKGEKYQLADKETMKKLLEKREKAIARLNERDERLMKNKEEKK